MSQRSLYRTPSTITVLGLCGLFVAAWVSCPYDSKIPLGDVATTDVDPALLGQWTSYMDDTPSEYTVRRLNEHEIYVEAQEYDENGRPEEDFGRMRAHRTSIDGVQFLSIKLLDEKPESGWLIARYDLVDNGKILRVCTISDEFVDKEFKTQADLVDYVRKNMKEKGFFEPPMIFSKK
ncbi:MAG: hypothetical protein AB1714_15410 [Acidobacteriota bacterium]